MSSRDDQPVRRVIIKKGHGGGHHGGAWKVAYADFVTTMMALFIVLWIVGQGVATREAIAKYFRDPGVFDKGGADSLSPGHTGILPGQPTPGGPAEPSDTSAAGPTGGLDAAAEEAKLQKAAAQLKELMEHSGLFESLREQIRVEVTSEGLRIELMERDNSNFFKVGSAAVLDSARPVLTNLAEVLARLPNQITVEGHTDSRQYSIAKNYSNWELSTDRAHSARRILEASNLPPGRIDRVIGYADNLLIDPKDPFNASNRRITIIVRRHDAPPLPVPRAAVPQTADERVAVVAPLSPPTSTGAHLAAANEAHERIAAHGSREAR
jgi:chemotaxis protein MotB